MKGAYLIGGLLALAGILIEHLNGPWLIAAGLFVLGAIPFVIDVVTGKFAGSSGVASDAFGADSGSSCDSGGDGDD